MTVIQSISSAMFRLISASGGPRGNYRIGQAGPSLVWLQSRAIDRRMSLDELSVVESVITGGHKQV